MSEQRPAAPSIVQMLKRLLREMERTVSKFPRNHRYRDSIGDDLRKACTKSVLLAQQTFMASRKPERQAALVQALSDLIDQIKLQWEIAYGLNCFSFNRSEEICRLLEEIGLQCGGWKRKIDQRSIGQNSADSGQRERASTLLNSRTIGLHGVCKQNVLQSTAWVHSRIVWSSEFNVPVLAEDEESLPQSKRQGLSPLRRTWHQSLRTLDDVRQLSCRHGRASYGAAIGPQGQQWQLREIELPLDHQEGKRQEPATLHHGHREWRQPLRRRVGRGNGTSSGYGECTPEARMVSGTRSDNASQFSQFSQPESCQHRVAHPAVSRRTRSAA